MRARKIIMALLLWASLGQPSPTVAAEVGILQISGSTWYVAAGRNQGLRVGDELEILSESSVVGRLVVRHLSQGRAACDLVAPLSPDSPPITSLLVQIPEYDRAAPAKEEPSPDGWRFTRSWPLLGSIQFRHDFLYRAGEGGGGLQRPSAAIRLRSPRGKGPWSFELNARSRRIHDGIGTSATETRLYRALLRWAPTKNGPQVEMGRFSPRAVSATGWIDGASLVWKKERWQIATFGGWRPSAVDLGFGSDRPMIGFGGRLRSTERRSFTWDTGLSLLSYQEDGIVGRDYAVLDARVRTHGLGLQLRQELDWLRDWRSEGDGSRIEATATLARTRAALGKGFELELGLDNRRALPVELPAQSGVELRERRLRQGSWASLRWRVPHGMQIRLRAQTRTGGGGAASELYQLGIYRIALPKIPVILELRASHYENDLLRGWQMGTAASAQRGSEWWWRLGGGGRQEEARGLAWADGFSGWLRGEVQWSPASNWFADLSLETEMGAEDTIFGSSAGVGYRF